MELNWNKIVHFVNNGTPEPAHKVTKSENEWKQLLTDEEGETVTLFTTDKILPKESPFMKQYPNVVGFPLYFEVSKQGLVMKFEAKEVSAKIPKKAFEVPKEGYEKMTMEEFNKSVSKMGGE